MRNVFWILKRDLTSYFLRPIGWVLLTGFLAVSGWYFSDLMTVEATVYVMRSELVFVEHLTMLVVPVISMRLIAEETEKGTLETLLSAPVRDVEVILAKFVAGGTFYAILLFSTFYYSVILHQFGTVDFASVLTGYVGTLLCGGLFLALGLFVSVAGRSQFMTVLITFLIIFLLRMMPNFIQGLEHGVVREVLTFLNYRTHLTAFRSGIVDVRDLLYFVSGTGMFLYLSYLSLGARRWQ